MEALSKQWKSLTLSEREGSGLCLKKEQASSEFSIAARFLTKRPLNIDAIAKTFTPLWRAKSGFKVKHIEEHVILFSFDNKADVDRILAAEPWSFDKSLMALIRYDKEATFHASVLAKIAFWVQVFDIPLRFRNREVAEQICESVGTIHHPVDAPDCDGGSFIRVRVIIDISRPLCRGRLITLEDGNEHWVSFKYERLTNFCYWCGCATHVDRDCQLWIDSEGSLNPADQQFGPWLRAPPFQASRKKVIMVPGFYAKKSHSLSTHLPSTPTSHPQPSDPQPSPSFPINPSVPSKMPNGLPETQTFTERIPPSAPVKSTVPTSPNIPTHPDFETLIHEIDREISRFDGEATAVQNSNVPLPAHIPTPLFPPLHPPSPSTERSDSQPNKPSPLRDLTNLGPVLSQSQVQFGGKWIRISRPAHLDENLPLATYTGKRKSKPSHSNSLPAKRRALGAASSDVTSSPTAEADPQPRRDQ